MVWYHTHNRSCSECIYFNTRLRAFPSFVLYILYSFEKGTQVHIHDVFMENEALPVKTISTCTYKQQGDSIPLILTCPVHKRPLRLCLSRVSLTTTLYLFHCVGTAVSIFCCAGDSASSIMGPGIRLGTLPPSLQIIFLRKG